MNYFIRGEALDTIFWDIMIINNVVVGILKCRIGNTQVIIDAHFCSLSHLSAATNQTVSLNNAMKHDLCSLETMGEDTQSLSFCGTDIGETSAKASVPVIHVENR